VRAAWLFEYPTLHGGERSLLAALPGLRSRGIEPVAIAPDLGPLADALRSAAIEVVALGPAEPIVVYSAEESGRTERKAMRGQQTLDERRHCLRKLLERLKPDLLHANSLSMGRLSGPVVAATRLPSIAHLRDIIKLSRAAVADLNRHTRLLAVSRATRGFHVAQGIDASRSHVCHNGVDLNEFRPRPPSGWLHRRLEIEIGAPVVVAIGQIVLRKGHDTFVRAAARLHPTLPHVHWALAGERHSQKAEAVEYERGLHEAVAAAGMGDRFHFLGTCDCVADLLADATLLAHPARQEPLGRVLLEAAAAGVPCVATDVGGTREIFPSPDLARLVLPDDEIALAAAIAGLLASPAERARLLRAARRRAEEAFDSRQAAAALAAHYHAALGREP
jgi:glycosyltransferase involved in cell wall biosynthesis